MTLVLGVITTSPAGGERTQDREVTHDFELVDFQPLDTGDDEAMMEESDDDTSAETPMEESEHGTSAETPMEETETEDGFVYENCDAARADGAAPVLEGERGFGPHLDRDNDGIGCEHWSGPSQAPAQGSGYQNCDEARADGATDIPASDPAYAEHLDRDKDGIACES